MNRIENVNEPLAITCREAAAMLKVSRRTLQRWCAEGVVPHRRQGKILLFSPRKLREWMDNSPLCQS